MISHRMADTGSRSRRKPWPASVSHHILAQPAVLPLQLRQLAPLTGGQAAVPPGAGIPIGDKPLMMDDPSKRARLSTE